MFPQLLQNARVIPALATRREVQITLLYQPAVKLPLSQAAREDGEEPSGAGCGAAVGAAGCLLATFPVSQGDEPISFSHFLMNESVLARPDGQTGWTRSGCYQPR